MSFSKVRFIKTLIFTLFLGFMILAALRAFGFIGSGPGGTNEPAELIRRANEGLEAVRKRQPGERRPAGFDAVLAPLDGLLKQCRTLMESESFDPVRDYDKIRSLALPIIDIATKADNYAKTEKGFMTKEYRFNSQKAEACQYLAATLWERINARLPETGGGYFNESPTYPAGEMRELRRILNEGIQSDPESGELFYTRGIVNRAEGLFAAAARDLERAAAITPEMPGVWNTLGLVYINLKDFAKAEDSLDRARAMALRQAEDFKLKDPGPEYTAILYNLATFHEGLATHYSRENRITPTVEYQHLAQRHAVEARKYFQDFLLREPASSADAQAARVKLQGL